MVGSITKYPVAWWEKQPRGHKRGYNWVKDEGHIWLCSCGARGKKRTSMHEAMNLWKKHANV